MPTHRLFMDTDHDVVIVGARCAGASTAMLLASQGLDVLVVDRGDLPSDTLSTHSIGRGGVVQLSRWGLLDAVLASGAPPIRTVSFHGPSEWPLVKVVKQRAGVDHLVAPRRYVLDEILLDAARHSGASVETGVTVTGVMATGGQVEGVHLRERDGSERTVRARVVVGADGVRSRIARAVGARAIDQRAADGAAHYTYVAGLDGEGFEFHVGAGGFAGVFQTHHGESNVWMCVPAARSLQWSAARRDGFLALLAEISPSLAARVGHATITAPVRSAMRLPNHVLEPAGPGWALVGDAGYHRDPITGHGITDAFRDAELLARHLGRSLRGETTEHEALASYGDERYRALLPIFDVTCMMATYPPAAEFIGLQRELSALIEAEADWLASFPPLASDDDVAAA